MLLLYNQLQVCTVSIALIYVAVYIQSEEPFSLIQKAKPETIQTNKGKWSKIEKQVKIIENGLL